VTAAEGERCARDDSVPRGPRAVLWDLDGTLVDSSRLWRAAYDDLARRLGATLSTRAWERCVGRTIEDSVEGLRAELGDHSDATTSALSEWLVGRAEARLDGGKTVDWQPGARQALETVQAAGIPTALVTTTWSGVVSRILAGHGVRFEATVCGDEVARGKPAPDPYLLAAQRLGVDITECLAVEDSATGVAAAEAAGARVLAVPSASAMAPAPGRTLRRSLVGLPLKELELAVMRTGRA
jgi:beta-phosphoglucomutase-like phosphatase (HAD superfamily)